MNTDIRLKLSFQSHPKTKKLRFKLGDEAVLSFIWLMMFVAANKPDGNLDGMDEEDIALAGDYGGDAAEFVDVLLAVRYLKKTESGYKIHDWKEHNAYAAGASKRSEKARNAANARYQKASKKDTAERQNKDLGKKTMLLAENSTAPSPSPSPSPKPIVRNLRFDEWWNAYDKKVGRKKCEEIWKSRNLDSKADLLIDDANNRRKHCRKWAAGYQANPQTYLNGDRWQDEIETKRPEKRVSGVPKSDEAAIQYGISHGIQAKPGESMWEYRNRLEAAT